MGEKLIKGPMVQRGDVWEVEIDGEELTMVVMPKSLAEEMRKSELLRKIGVSVCSDESPVGKKMLLAVDKKFETVGPYGRKIQVSLVKKAGQIKADGSFKAVTEGTNNSN